MSTFIDNMIDLIRSLPENQDYLFYDSHNDLWICTNEFLCGSFAGRSVKGNNEYDVIRNLIEYFDNQIKFWNLQKSKGLDGGIVGDILIKSGWPNLEKFKTYVLQNSISEEISQ